MRHPVTQGPDAQLALTPAAQAIYDTVRDLPIVSPHGHCDPGWFAADAAFPDPASLLIVPDHYVFRMLYSRGVSLTDLGIGVPPEARDGRAIFRLFARHYHLFLGTPSHLWWSHVLHDLFGLSDRLTAENADAVYDRIDAALKTPGFRPRALFDRFGIAWLATTDGALDGLEHHATIRAGGWAGRVIPTFRPDAVLNPQAPGFAANVKKLGALTGCDCGSLAGYLDALRARRAAFKAMGATATDHDVPDLHTEWLDRSEAEGLFSAALKGRIAKGDAVRLYGHLLIEMAQMSLDDGLVMQLHAGSSRSTNRALLASHGRDMGADIPHRTDWVGGLDALLNRVGNRADLTVIAFTLDESAYARELAPMAGHWPALRLGPPWWFHDSVNGIRRYFDGVVETAGYENLTGFNDDTRAFLSIPARHDLWRRAVSLHLADQVSRGLFGKADALHLARRLSHDLAVETYRLGA
ncbi:MAG: glucuronate isomerase [Paracoccaceae bacterium]|nr:glucuronate isomerase [Paracoccaceae bacterium]